MRIKFIVTISSFMFTVHARERERALQCALPKPVSQRRCGGPISPPVFNVSITTLFFVCESVGEGAASLSSQNGNSESTSVC